MATATKSAKRKPKPATVEVGFDTMSVSKFAEQCLHAAERVPWKKVNAAVLAGKVAMLPLFDHFEGAANAVYEEIGRQNCWVEKRKDCICVVPRSAIAGTEAEWANVKEPF